MTIAVTGATGQLGRLAIEALAKQVDRRQLVALARDPRKLTDIGSAVRAFDYDRSGVLGPALADVRTLVLISSSEIGKRVEQHRNVIAAAKAAGVGRIVYTSLLHADVSPLSLAQEHLAAEADLRGSGLPFTVLRNGWYTENYTNSIRGALAHGALIGSSGDGRISAAARVDYAEALAAVATSHGHDGKVYELAGDEAWTLADLAAELSRQSARDIPYRDLPVADYAAALIDAGVAEGFAHALAGWEEGASRNALFDDGRQLSTLIGRPTTPLSVTVAQVLR